MNEISDPIQTRRTRKSIRLRAEVSSRYQQLRAIYPDASNNLLYTILAEEKDLSVPGVRSMCIKAGVTSPVRQQQ